jgi:ATP-dependent RNA helicase RhlB
MLILDEADRMLDMGFIPDVRQIVYSTPHKDKRQTLFFSATLTPDVTRLSASWTRDPLSVEIEPEQVAVDTVEQVVYIITTDEKFALTYNIITRQNLDRVLVFCNRRDETRRLAEMLDRYRINCAVLSGEVPQKKRIRTLDQFKSGKIRVLVATDVAGRGIHIEGMDYVINFTLPHDPEDYVHRIGRTGRAGAAGTSISFACEEDGFYLPAIEAFIGRPLPCIPPEEGLAGTATGTAAAKTVSNPHPVRVGEGRKEDGRDRVRASGAKRPYRKRSGRPSLEFQKTKTDIFCMTPRNCMINVMADLIGLDETYKGDRLNDPAVWDRFMDELFKRMDQIEDKGIRDLLNSIDTDEFQCWIDEPGFWSAIQDEIDRRLNLVKTLLPSRNQGHC